MAEDLIAYIKNCQAQGIPQDVIETNLIQINWTKEQIDQAVEQIKFQPEEEKSPQPELKESESSKKIFAIFAIIFFVLSLAVAGAIYYFLYLQ